MLTADQRQHLHGIEEQLQRSDPALARSLRRHQHPWRRRLADRCQRLLAAWMNAAGDLHHFYPGHRWY